MAEQLAARPDAAQDAAAPARPRGTTRPLMELAADRRLRRPTLSFALLTLITTLLVTTVGALAVVSVVVQGRSVEALQGRTIAATTLVIGFVMSSQMAPAEPLLLELRSLAQRDLISLDDHELLGQYLAERLRHQTSIAWLSYSDEATGRFVGVWRREDGSIMLNRSDPAVRDGYPTEVEVTLDGRLLPFFRPLAGGYDPRGRGWYQQAAASDGLVWTEPFLFNEGVRGVTAALAVPAQAGTTPAETAAPGPVRGVFTADFSLTDITQYLTALSRSRSEAYRPLYVVLSRRGNVVASVSGAGPESAVTGLEAALAALPARLEELPLGQSTPVIFVDGGVTYAAQVRALAVRDGLEWVVLAAVPRDEFLEVVYENRRIALLVGLGLLLVAVGIGSWIAQRIARPLGMIADDLRRVGELDLTTTPSPRSLVHETVVVSDAVDRMKASLRSFGHYVPVQLVHELLQSGVEARLGGTARELTIFFSDIVGFTSISERMDPAALVDHLGEYLEAMTAIIEAEQGVVDKFVGDGIMALFNAPRALPDHPTAACRAALQAQARLRVLAERWQVQGRPALRTRIGLHTGEAIVGNIGTPQRFDFTVVGDAVNLASRLEGLNKLYGTEILASEAVRQAASPALAWRTLDRVAVVGRSGGATVCELLGERATLPADALVAAEQYEAGLSAYLAGRFGAARVAFSAALAWRPADQATRLLLARTEELERNPPGTWDGVYHATSK